MRTIVDLVAGTVRIDSRAAASPQRRWQGLVRALALAAVIVVAGLVLWVATRPSDTRLHGSIWGLESATFEGVSVDIATNGEPVRWQFGRTCDSGPHTGPGCHEHSSLEVRGGCGTHEVGVVYDGSTVRWTGDAREIAPACVGEITAAMIAVGQSGSFDVGFDDDRLVVVAPDDSAELVFAPIASVGWGD